MASTSSSTFTSLIDFFDPSAIVTGVSLVKLFRQLVAASRPTVTAPSDPASAAIRES
jgi:hypothetical protein